MKTKLTILLLTVLFLGSSSLAQPSQEMPHRVFGTVEDTQGNAVTDTEVEVVFDGETFASDTTNSDGYYDITVPYAEEYSNEEVQIQVSGSQVESFTYSSGEVEEIDLTIDVSQPQNNQNNQHSGGGGGGGAGAFPSTGQDETPSNNNTETSNNTNSTENSTDSSQDDTDSADTDSEDSTENTEGNQTSQNTGNAITGMFTGATSSIGNLVTGFIDAIISTIASIFG